MRSPPVPRVGVPQFMGLMALFVPPKAPTSLDKPRSRSQGPWVGGRGCGVPGLAGPGSHQAAHASAWGSARHHLAPAPHLSLLSFKRHPRPRGYHRADSAVTGPGISRAASCPLVLAGDKGRMSPRPLPRGLQLPPSLRAQPPVCHRVLRGTGLLGCAWIMAHEQGPGLGTAEDFSLGKRSSWTPPVAPSTGQRRVVTINAGTDAPDNSSELVSSL